MGLKKNSIKSLKYLAGDDKILWPYSIIRRREKKYKIKLHKKTKEKKREAKPNIGPDEIREHKK